MRIRIHDDAANNYVARCYRGAHPECGMLHRPAWADMLRKVQGKWLEVETDYLFGDQFNTAPVPGVSENGMRVMASDVSQIEDDIRPGRYFSRWSNRHAGSLSDFNDSELRHAVVWKANPHNPACMIETEVP